MQSCTTLVLTVLKVFSTDLVGLHILVDVILTSPLLRAFDPLLTPCYDIVLIVK